MIEAKIICDSIATSEVRLTTFVVTYPRYIHSELMTHRAFSRNASSSRAIPVEKQIQMVIENPAIPAKFFKNQKGMQGTELLIGEEAEQAKNLWLKGRDYSVQIAKEMLKLNIHKQHINRVTEPYAFISVVITATDWANFFYLRKHKDADPTIQVLAESMWSIYNKNKPKFLLDGQWHLPFIDEETIENTDIDFLEKVKTGISTKDHDYYRNVKRSAAKCARVSFLTHEGKKSTFNEDLGLHTKLVGSQPLHASPTEHQAMACGDPNVRSGNFRGWIQYRQTLKGQNVMKLPEDFK